MNTANDQPQKSRSMFVTVLAWIFIVMSGFAAFISLLQNIMVNTIFPMDQMQSAMQEASQMHEMPLGAELMFRHFRLIIAIFLVVTTLTCATSMALLFRKNWARIVFICILILGIVWNIVSLYFQHSMISAMPPLPTNAPSDFQTSFKLMESIIIAFTVVMSVGISIVFAWIIKKLSSSTIRNEFE